VALMARAIGAGDEGRARRVLCATAVLSVAIASLANGIVWTIPFTLLRALNASEGSVQLAVPYFRWTALSSLLFSVSFSFESGLRSHRLTQAPMRIAVVVAAVKAVMNYSLIYGHMGFGPMGLLGAGYASIAAHAAGLLLYLQAARSANRQGYGLTFGLGELRSLREAARDVLVVALPAIGERFIMSLALLTYFALLSDYGNSAVAAYAIGVRMLSFSWVPGLGFSTAASTFVGQALGREDAAGARNAARRSVSLAIAVMAVLGVVCLLARQPLARLFTNDESVIADLLPFILMLGLAQPFMGAHFTLGGVLRGAGDTVSPLIAAGVGNWIFRVPLAFLYAKVFSLSLVWVWSALIVDHFARMVFNGLVFLRGRWAERLGVRVSRGAS
jgi:putative MATE family efflux protein